MAKQERLLFNVQLFTIIYNLNNSLKLNTYRVDQRGQGQILSCGII